MINVVYNKSTIIIKPKYHSIQTTPHGHYSNLSLGSLDWNWAMITKRKRLKSSHYEDDGIP